MRKPTIGIRSEVEVITENILGSHELLKLDQETIPTNIHVERIERLHVIELALA